MLYRDVLRYLGQPMPDLTGIFTLPQAQTPPVQTIQPVPTEEEQIKLLQQYPVAYQPYISGGDGGGQDDENVIDTTNNAGIYSLSDLFSKIPTPLNLARTAIDNINNPYTNITGALNQQTREAIAREDVRDLQNRIDKGEFGSTTPTNQDARRGGQYDGGGGISDSQAAANQDAARGGQYGRDDGGGNGGGGGKIVCTMMNESYGFGSFRNKIWLKHSKSLAPEYQKGYHKIFLPLVKYSKQKGLTNKIVKNILEHIAVHRTIDIRQESRGKTHLLGRIYRKILEPICYLVGKHG